MEPDADAEYAAVIDIDLADIKEPLLVCPNDPDDVKTWPTWPVPRSTRSSSVPA